MSLNLLPALSLGARLDEIERTARELFGDAVTISAETETQYTRSDEAPKPDKSINVVIKIELPGAFPKLTIQEGARVVGDSSDPADSHTHTRTHGAPPSSPTARDESRGRGAASSGFDEACGVAPTSLVFDRQRVVSAAEVHYESRFAAHGQGAYFHVTTCGICQAVEALIRAREGQQNTTGRAGAEASEKTPDAATPAEASGGSIPSLPAIHLASSPSAQWKPITAEEIRSLYREHMPYEDAAQRIADALNAKRGETAPNVSGIGQGDPEKGALQQGPVIPPKTTRLRVRCDRDYVVKQIRLAFLKCDGWRSVATETLPSLAEAAATAAIELLGQDAGTQRAPVKLPRFDERSGRWSLVTEKGSGTYVNGLDAIRQALADAGVEYEDRPAAPLGRPEDQA